MATFRLDDFQCLDCEHVFEFTWTKPTGTSEEALGAWKGEAACPQCESLHVDKLLSAPGLAEFSLKDAQGRSDSLRKRSEDHSKKLMRQDMDKHRATIKRKIASIKK